MLIFLYNIYKILSILIDIVLSCLYYIHLYSFVTLEDSLAHTISAKKRIRQNEKNRLKNRVYKTLLKNLEKKVNKITKKTKREI